MSNDVISDFELQQKIRDLDVEIEPGRDLWQGIERRVMALPQKRPLRERMLPLGVAASVVMAVSALILSIAQLQWHLPQDNKPIAIAHEEAYLGEGMALMSLDRELANEFIDPVARGEIFQSLAILVRARAEIYEQIQDNPGDHRLRRMLAKVQAQERELLALEFGEQVRPFYRESL